MLSIRHPFSTISKIIIICVTKNKHINLGSHLRNVRQSSHAKRLSSQLSSAIHNRKSHCSNWDICINLVNKVIFPMSITKSQTDSLNCTFLTQWQIPCSTPLSTKDNTMSRYIFVCLYEIWESPTHQYDLPLCYFTVSRPFTMT